MLARAGFVGVAVVPVGQVASLQLKGVVSQRLQGCLLTRQQMAVVAYVRLEEVQGNYDRQGSGNAVAYEVEWRLAGPAVL